MNIDFGKAWPMLVVIIPGLIAWGATTTTVSAQGEQIEKLEAKVEAIDATARAEEIDQAVFEQKVDTMVTEQKSINEALGKIAEQMAEANRRASGGGS